MSPKDNFRMLVIREDCFDTFFKDFNFFNIDCLKATISKGLGYGIIAGACFVKVPQIIKILMNKSVEGLSRESTYLELLSNILTAIWFIIQDKPFSAYGETVIVALGSFAVMCLLWAYRYPGFFHIAAVGTVIAAVASFALQLPHEYLNLLQYSTGALFASARLTQIAEIYRTKTAGALSPLTLFMNFAGTAARIFTSIQEVGDPTQLFFTVLNTALNGLLLGQYIVYDVLRGSKPNASTAAKSSTPRKTRSKKND